MADQKLNLVQAINQALAQEMDRDPTVVVLGEDVGVDGGVFRVTDGLIQKFGPERVMDTPISEMGIAGTAIGMAIAGLKPVGEIQFDGFSYLTFNQMFNHAARMSYRTRGSFHVSMVLRFPTGGGIRALEHHSESPEAYYMHTAGLKVVYPSNPYDAKGLLVSAIRDPDPVIYMEPKRYYRAFKEDVPDELYSVPLGQCKILQEGTDVTLVTFGGITRVCLDALKELKDKAENISVELIDLRTLSPLDRHSIVNSVKKTGRLLVVQEAPPTCGIASEIITLVNEKTFLSLQAPPKRVTGFDVPFPYARSEHFYLPDTYRIKKALRELMQF